MPLWTGSQSNAGSCTLQISVAQKLQVSEKFSWYIWCGFYEYQFVLQEALNKLGLPGTERYLKTLMDQFNKDGDNTVRCYDWLWLKQLKPQGEWANPGTYCLQIDFSDFKAYALRTQDSVSRCFAALDNDGSGSISVDDLVIISNTCQGPCDSQTWSVWKQSTAFLVIPNFQWSMGL